VRTRLVAIVLFLSSLALGGIAFTPAASAATPRPVVTAPAHRAAPGFNASGIWWVYQSNGYAVRMSVAQDSAGTLFGSASFGGSAGTITSGSVSGRNIYFTIGWSNGSQGRYTGALGPDRRLSGYTFDVRHPFSQANWHTNSAF
jgi:hypothetical protein